ncbi:hypothetical protein KA005_70745, partial [bacterium]|nr:hypothetical protein [bacterium]
VEQLWLKDRANSVVFPEKAPEINQTRIKALTTKNNRQMDKKLLNEAKPQGIVNNGADNLLNYHLYRVWLAEFLVKKNIQKNPRASGSAISSLKTIPAFALLGDLARLLENQTKIENQNLILLSRPEEYWQAIDKERARKIEEELSANSYPFDVFVLDAFFAHESGHTNGGDKELLFFSFPLDPIDLTEGRDNREHGALWSGFLLVPKGEADLLANDGKGASNGDYARLLWRIQTLRSSLNILGQPCVRRQLEAQIRQGESLKAKVAMFDMDRKEKKKLKAAFSELSDAVREVEDKITDVRRLLRIDMGKHLTSWWGILDRIFALQGTVAICGCSSLSSNHTPSQVKKDWKELMAAGLLKFVLAENTKMECSHQEWLKICLEDEKMCDPFLAETLKRLSVVNNDGAIDDKWAWVHYKYGWKEGINDFKDIEGLTLTMLEWAIGAKLAVEDELRTYCVPRCSIELREAVLAGVYDFFLALIKNRGMENKPITINCVVFSDSISVCLSKVIVAEKKPEELFRDGVIGVRKLFKVAVDKTVVPNRGKRTTTWGLLRSLGWNPDKPDVRPELAQDGSRLALNNVSAYWDDGLWLAYSKPKGGDKQ